MVASAQSNASAGKMDAPQIRSLFGIEFLSRQPETRGELLPRKMFFASIRAAPFIITR
jgi:hypothetical protein